MDALSGDYTAVIDWQALFNVAIGLVMFILGALSKVLWDTLTVLREDMRQLSVMVNNLPTVYVRRDDFRDHREDFKDEFARMQTVLDRIETKLDHKADRGE